MELLMYVNWLLFVPYKWFIFTFTLVCVGFLRALIDPGGGTFIIICNNIMTLHINASGCMFLSSLLIAIFYSSVKLLSLLSGAWLEGTVIRFGCSALCWRMLYCVLSCQSFKKVTFRGKNGMQSIFIGALCCCSIYWNLCTRLFYRLRQWV